MSETVVKKDPKTVGLNYKEYKYFRDFKQDEMKELELVHVTIEKRISKTYGDSIALTAHLDKRWKIEFTGKQAMSTNDYNLLTFDHPQVDESKSKHELFVPARFLERRDEAGEVKYRRFEIAFTPKLVMSKFLDSTDLSLCERLRPSQKFFVDKDSSEVFESVQDEIMRLWL